MLRPHPCCHIGKHIMVPLYPLKSVTGFRNMVCERLSRRTLENACLLFQGKKGLQNKCFKTHKNLEGQSLCLSHQKSYNQ